VSVMSQPVMCWLSLVVACISFGLSGMGWGIRVCQVMSQLVIVGLRLSLLVFRLVCALMLLKCCHCVLLCLCDDGCAACYKFFANNQVVYYYYYYFGGFL